MAAVDVTATASNAATTETTTTPPLHALLAENAQLRAALQRSEAQRVTDEVVRAQLDVHLTRAVAALEHLAGDGDKRDDSDDGGGGGGDDAPRVLRVAVAAALQCVTAAKSRSDAQLREVCDGAVAALQSRVEALECDKAALQRQLCELRAGAARRDDDGGGDNDAVAPPLGVEVAQLRASEALLRRQLAQLEQSALTQCAERVAAQLARAADGLAAAPSCDAQAAALRAAQGEVRLLRAVAAVEVGEANARAAVLRDAAAAHAEATATALRAQLADAQRRAAQGDELVAALRDENAALQRELARVRAVAEGGEGDEENGGDDGGVASSSRRRLRDGKRRREDSADDGGGDDGGGGAAGDVDARRARLRARHAADDEAAELRARVCALESAAATAKELRKRVAQHDAARASLAARLVALDGEVARLRGDNRATRAQLHGATAAAAQLRAHLAVALRGHADDDELRRCAEALRSAAAREAAASAAVVVDDAALQRAERQARELQTAVARLQRQKEQLLRFVERRQERVLATLQTQALSLAAAGGGVSLPQLLEFVRLCAQDVYDVVGAEACAAGGGGGGNKNGDDAAVGAENADAAAAVSGGSASCVLLGRRLTDAYERLAATQRRLRDAHDDIARLQSQVRDDGAAHARALAQRDEACAAATAAAQRMTASAGALLAQHAQLQRRHAAAVGVARVALLALTGVSRGLRDAYARGGALRGQLAQQRASQLAVLWQYEADAWSGDDGRRAAAAAALERLRGYVADAVAACARRADDDDACYIARLAAAVRQHERWLRELRGRVGAALTSQSGEIVARVLAAQSQCEARWRDHVAAAAAEQARACAQRGASESLFARLEATCAQLSAQAEAPQARGAVADDAVATSTERAVAAIRAFVAVARAQPPPPPPPPQQQATAPEAARGDVADAGGVSVAAAPREQGDDAVVDGADA